LRTKQSQAIVPERVTEQTEKQNTKLVFLSQTHKNKQ